MNQSNYSKLNRRQLLAAISFSLRFRLIALFLLVILIPFLLSGIVTYINYVHSVERNARSSTLEIIEQVTINLDRFTKDLERVTLAPYYDASILQILEIRSNKPGSPTYATALEQNRVNLFLSGLSYDRRELRGIFLFANDGSLFSNLGDYGINTWQPQNETWLEQVRQADGGLSLVSGHFSDNYSQPRVQVFSIARQLKNPITQQPIGFIKADLTPLGLEQILFPVSFSKNSRIYIADKSGLLIYPTMGQKLPVDNPAQTEARLNGQNYLQAARQSDFTGLQVIGLISIEDLQKDANQLVQLTAIISLLAMLLACGLGIVFSNRLIRPIQHLRSKMKLVQQGNFNERASVFRSDEIGELAGSFNAMVSEIDRLISEVYEAHLREREAELAALQSQINPHFLYNTLESINMLALREKNYDVSALVSSLGKLLRYTVDRQEKQVQLRDEIQFVEAYLSIQTLRFGDRLQTEIHIDPALEECLVPKLILQPLVENALEHGLAHSGGKICLSAQVQAEDLLLVVQDNGVGMNLNELDKLREQLQAPNSNRTSQMTRKGHFGTVKKGIGLRNIHQRVNLLYGEPYGLSVETIPPAGSQFTVRLPYQWEN